MQDSVTYFSKPCTQNSFRHLIPITLRPKPQRLLCRLTGECFLKEGFQLLVLPRRFGERGVRVLHPGGVGKIDVMSDAAFETFDVVAQAGALGVAGFNSG